MNHMFNVMHYQFADKPDSLLFNLFLLVSFLLAFFWKAFSSWSVIDW